MKSNFTIYLNKEYAELFEGVEGLNASRKVRWLLDEYKKNRE